jgi:pyruvate/2-oxoglutarate dehydrogenase complex dihydrolipoamide dehydrogenase (E3) component
MVAEALGLYRCVNKSERSLPEFMENVSSLHQAKPAGPEEYDFVILGGGTGSTIAAWTFAAQGQRVAVIDRKYIGGSCPNIACLPSKNILHSARVASYFRRGEEFGIEPSAASSNRKALIPS